MVRLDNEIKNSADAKSAIDEQLLNVAESFRSSLPELQSRIESYLTDLNEKGDHNCLNEAIIIAHQIRGSAGTLGLKILSQAYGALEDQLDLYKKEDLWGSPEGQTALSSSIDLCRMLVASDQNIVSSPGSSKGQNDSKRLTPLVTTSASLEDVDKIVNESDLVVLLVEDDPYFISIVQTVLSSVNEVNGILSAKTVAEAERFLAGAEADIILLDLNLSDSTGLDTFHRMHELAPDVPILILTARDDTPLAEESLACGAQDYLVKGRISPDSIRRCIRYSITRFRAEQSVHRLQAIEDFVSTLAHDLRVPAQGADLLLKHILQGHVTSLNPELKHALTILNHSNSELLDKLDKLINLYNLEFGSVKPEWAMVPVLPLIYDALEKRRSDIEEKEISMDIRNGVGPQAQVFTDAQLIQEVITQLIDNAIKFSPQCDTVSINISGTSRSSDQFLTISISNHGQAIPTGERKGLFKKFWRGTPGVSYVANSGLGLYSCKQILKLLKGTISCRSNQNLTTFTVRLPIAATTNGARSSANK